MIRFGRARRSSATLLLSATAALAAAAPLAQRPSGPDSASRADFDLQRLSRVDEVIREGIEEKKLPGAVLLVGRGDRTIYRKVYGRRAVVPADEPMTLDTMFDL